MKRGNPWLSGPGHRSTRAAPTDCASCGQWPHESVRKGVCLPRAEAPWQTESQSCYSPLEPSSARCVLRGAGREHATATADASNAAAAVYVRGSPPEGIASCSLLCSSELDHVARSGNADVGELTAATRPVERHDLSGWKGGQLRSGPFHRAAGSRSRTDRRGGRRRKPARSHRASSEARASRSPESGSWRAAGRSSLRPTAVSWPPRRGAAGSWRRPATPKQWPRRSSSWRQILPAAGDSVRWRVSSLWSIWTGTPSSPATSNGSPGWCRRGRRARAVPGRRT